jgi:hypothetical protein
MWHVCWTFLALFANIQSSSGLICEDLLNVVLASLQWVWMRNDFWGTNQGLLGVSVRVLYCHSSGSGALIVLNYCCDLLLFFLSITPHMHVHWSFYGLSKGCITSCNCPVVVNQIVIPKFTFWLAAGTCSNLIGSPHLGDTYSWDLLLCGQGQLLPGMGSCCCWSLSGSLRS